MKILFIGSLENYGTCFHRMESLIDLGHNIERLDTRKKEWKMFRWLEVVLKKVDYHLFDWRLDPTSVNTRLKKIVSESSGFDLIWFEKPLMIRPITLMWLRSAFPATILVSYSPDDQLNPSNHSKQYLNCLPFYDIAFTNKSFNVNELKKIGARQVFLVGNGFNPGVHRPIELTLAERERFASKVCFIGSYEEQRGLWLKQLAADSLQIKIWGNGWANTDLSRLFPEVVMGRAVYGNEYAKTICASEINLCFLRKANRDRITTRSIEIPACGGFMVAERTDEHLEYFEEDKEAVYFSSYEELKDKIIYYLKNPRIRQTIAKAGRKRCLRSGYSNQDQMRKIMSRVLDFKTG
jgi:glycosyltransferase involved in cell wall biosynthesis